jgi:hypothetical protein
MPFERVTSDRLRRFLERLGSEYRGPGRIYLVGGTSLLLDGLKAATKDVDLSISLAPRQHEDFVRALIRLRNELQIAVEEVSPGDFIPLPSGVENRHRYLGRTGQLEVFSFDPVSTALAKLARGRAQDISDVLALLHNGHLEVDVLVTAFEEILPRVATEALTITEDDFRRKFTAFLALARERGST